jgi:hypothetical protein
MSPAEIRLSLQNLRDSTARQAESAEQAAEAFAHRSDDMSVPADNRRSSMLFAQDFANRAKRYRRRIEALDGALQYVPELEAAGGE